MESIEYHLGGTFRGSYYTLNDNIINGRIRGVAGVVGLLVLMGVIAVVFVGIGDGDKGKAGGEDKPVAGKSDTSGTVKIKSSSIKLGSKAFIPLSVLFE